MYAIYMVTFTINIPPMLAYIPYMDPMGNGSFYTSFSSFSHQFSPSRGCRLGGRPRRMKPGTIRDRWEIPDLTNGKRKRCGKSLGALGVARAKNGYTLS
jgi:hypothetical protein